MSYVEKLTVKYKDGSGQTVTEERDIRDAETAAEVADLKSQFDTQIGNWIFSVSRPSVAWQNIDVYRTYSENEVIYVKPLSSKNVTGNIIVYGYAGETATNLGSIPVGGDGFFTLQGSYDRIRVSYHLTAALSDSTQYEAIITTVNDGTISGEITGLIQKSQSLLVNEQKYDSPFSVVVPDNIIGIIDVNINNDNYIIYQKYRINRFTHNSSWDVYAALQGFNGESWVNIDTWTRAIADAPNPKPAVDYIVSYYGRATMTIIWSAIGENINYTNGNYVLKNDVVVDKPQNVLRSAVNKNTIATTIPSFELSDHIPASNVIKVKADGTGDYSTIADAYAAITDSAFDNQYEIVVYPGTYNENNLQPPAYTHTHGIFPMQTIVDSTGTTGDGIDQSVFDQGYAPSKLSNLWIKSATKYCVHQDVELRGITLVNENLYCEKLPGGSQVSDACIGIGADFDGAKFVWRNCTFINGSVTSHTNPNDLPNANQHIIYENCTFVNAFVSLMVSGNTFGEYVCELKGCKANIGNNGLQLKCGTAIGGIPVNFPWQIIGGDNNFAPIFINSSDTTVDDWWECINTNEKEYVVASASIAKGKFVTDSGTVANASTPKQNVVGVAVDSGSSGDFVPVWGGAIPFTGTAGEYGIDANGELSASATTKIGYVFNNIFYPY